MAQEGRLLARPESVRGRGSVGLLPLALGGRRDGLLYVPDGYAPDRPAPLVLMLHGAGGTARHAIDPLLSVAGGGGLILLAPESQGRTWDVILAGYGPDIAFIDRALAQTFARYAVDPERIAVEGFSDGASYALSIGLPNGDLFASILAFSPGFMVPAAQRGSPRIYVSHGTQDAVLPIAVCSRRLVPGLRDAGLDVTYHEFDGGHTVPPDIFADAISWLTAERAPQTAP